MTTYRVGYLVGGPAARSIDRSLANALTTTDEGEVTLGSTEGFLCNQIAEFHTFVGRVLTVLSGGDA